MNKKIKKRRYRAFQEALRTTLTNCLTKGEKAFLLQADTL